MFYYLILSLLSLDTVSIYQFFWHRFLTMNKIYHYVNDLRQPLPNAMQIYKFLLYQRNITLIIRNITLRLSLSEIHGHFHWMFFTRMTRITRILVTSGLTSNYIRVRINLIVVFNFHVALRRDDRVKELKSVWEHHTCFATPLVTSAKPWIENVSRVAQLRYFRTRYTHCYLLVFTNLES